MALPCLAWKRHMWALSRMKGMHRHGEALLIDASAAGRLCRPSLVGEIGSRTAVRFGACCNHGNQLAKSIARRIRYRAVCERRG